MIVLDAICIAIVGSLALGVCEWAAGLVFAPTTAPPVAWPVALLGATAGRAIATHLLLWVSAMVACGLVCALVVRRWPSVAPEAFLPTAFLALAVAVIVPPEMDLLRGGGGGLLAVALITGWGICAAVYFLLRLLLRRCGARGLRRVLHVAAGAAVAVTLILVGMFVRSPLFNPGEYRVPNVGISQRVAARPDILWIVLDTVRADRLSVYGYEAPTTPFLKRWARQCLVFERAVADGTWTMPSHASMFTGIPARTHGVGVVARRLDPSFTTVATVLTRHGYTAASFSNNGLVGPSTNITRGFDTQVVVADFMRRLQFSLQRLSEQWGITPLLPWLDLDDGGAVTNYLVDRWLEDRTSAPVFVFINYMEAHQPFMVPRPYRAAFMSQRAVHRSYDLLRRVYGPIKCWIRDKALLEGYDEMPSFERETMKRQYEAALRYLDVRVEEVLGIFGRHRALDNTLVIVTSDHGEYLDTHNMWGHYYFAYEDLAHVPLIIRQPGRSEGTRITSPVQLSDLHLTVTRFALGQGAPVAGPHVRDLLALPGQPPRDRITICEYFAVGPEQRRRLLANPDPEFRHRAWGQVAATDYPFKYIESDDGRKEFYDLAADPGELHNLGGWHWKREQLGRYVQQWRDTTPVFQPDKAADTGPDAYTKEALRALGYIESD